MHIYAVENLCFNFFISDPPQIILVAHGKTRTSGWENGEIVPRKYIIPPADGTQEFDFIATKPKGMVLQVISPITASVRIEKSDWIKRVRVYAETNDISTDLLNRSCITEIVLPDGESTGGDVM